MRGTNYQPDGEWATSQTNPNPQEVPYGRLPSNCMSLSRRGSLRLIALQLHAPLLRGSLWWTAVQLHTPFRRGYLWWIALQLQAPFSNVVVCGSLKKCLSSLGSKAKKRGSL